MPFLASGSGRCLPGKRACRLRQQRTQPPSITSQTSKSRDLLPAASPRELASASILVAAPLPSALFSWVGRRLARAPPTAFHRQRALGGA